jgi:hypothetical protein
MNITRMPNKTLSHSMSTNNISSMNHGVVHEADGLIKSASKKSGMFADLILT